MAIITVTTTADSGAGSLRDAIARAQSGDVIQFSSALSNQTIALTSGELTISNGKNLTIDATGVSGLTLSGNQQSRIFNVESTFVSQTQFTVKNLTLAGAATSGQGGAVYATDQAQLQFDNVIFRDNVADRGGASIFTNRGSVLVTNSRFENNQATAANDERGSAGITAVEASTVTVLNSVFEGNKGINGAAINTLNSQLIVRDSQFLNNDVSAASYATNDPNGNNFLRGYGGAIYTDRASDSIIIENSVFEGNSSRAAGGALYLFNDPEDQVTIANSSFRDNQATGLPQGESGNGGAIEHQRNSLGSGTLTLTDVSFVGNTANGQGGALRERNANTTITNATVAENQVFGDSFSNNGGGFVFSGAGTANVVNSTIAYNQAGWVGGGIAAENGVQVNLKNSIFYQNTANNGGNGWGILQQSNRQFTDNGGNFQWPPGVNSDSNVSAQVTLADVKLGTRQQVGALDVYPLLASSPAIDAAVAGAPAMDILGASRIGAADSGALEFGGTPPNPNPNPVTIAVGTVTNAEGNGPNTLLVPVTLSAASTQSVTVNYSTADGSAIAGSDYTATTGTLTFDPGVTSQTIAIPVLGDTTVEPDEQFLLNLTQPTNATIAQGQGTATITNDDVATPDLPTVAIGNTAVVEGNNGTTNAVFTVNLSAASTAPVSVTYGTADGSAIAGSDYTAITGTLTFDPGVTSQTIAIPVLGDTTVEPDEQFVLNLTQPTNATIAQGQGTATITNDDVATPDLPTVAIGNTAVVEGNNGTTNAVFTVNLSAASTAPVSVTYGTADGSAIAGSDYTATAGTLTFDPGVTSQTIAIPVLGDTVVEADETFVLNLGQPSNATIAQGQGTATITNDDVAIPPGEPPTLAIGNVIKLEGNRGVRDFVFTVKLSEPSNDVVTVGYGTQDRTAIAGSDYDSVTGLLTFNPGETTKHIHVGVRGDRSVEPIETFDVRLSNPTNALIRDDLGIGVVVNDDFKFLQNLGQSISNGLGKVDDLLGNPFDQDQSNSISSLVSSRLDALSNRPPFNQIF